MTDIAQLGFSIDTAALDKGIEKLTGLESQSNKLGARWEKLFKKLDDITNLLNKTSNASANLNKTTKDQIEQYEKLNKKIKYFNSSRIDKVYLDIVDSVNKVSKAHNYAKNKLSLFNTKLKSTINIASKLTKPVSILINIFGKLRKGIFSLTGAIIGISFGLLIKNFIDAAASAERLRVKLDAFTKGQGAGYFDHLVRMSALLPVNTEQLIDVFTKLQAYGLKPTDDLMLTLVDTMSALGGEADSLSGIARALGQIETKGRVSAEEINQLAEQGVNARRYLNEAFGLMPDSFNELDIAIKKSGHTTSEAIQAIIKGMDKDFGGMSKRLEGTWSGLMKRLEHQWFIFRKNTMEKGIFQFLKSEIEKFLKFLESPEGTKAIDEWSTKISDSIFKTTFFVIKSLISLITTFEFILNGVQISVSKITSIALLGDRDFREYKKNIETLKELTAQESGIISRLTKDQEKAFKDLEYIMSMRQTLIAEGYSPEEIEKLINKQLDILSKPMVTTTLQANLDHIQGMIADTKKQIYNAEKTNPLFKAILENAEKDVSEGKNKIVNILESLLKEWESLQKKFKDGILGGEKKDILNTKAFDEAQIALALSVKTMRDELYPTTKALNEVDLAFSAIESTFEKAKTTFHPETGESAFSLTSKEEIELLSNYEAKLKLVALGYSDVATELFDTVDATDKYNKALEVLTELHNKELITGEEFLKYLKKIKEENPEESIEKATYGVSEFSSELSTTISTMRDLFETGSSGYQNLSIALQGLNAIQQINTAMTLEGATALATFNAYAAAAVAAVTVVSKILGSDDKDYAAIRQAKLGTGSILFGGDTEKTKSIEKSVKITSEATSELVGINREMLQALVAVQQGIKGAAAITGRRYETVDIPSIGKLNNFDKFVTLKPFSFLPKLLGFDVGGFFGGKTKLKDEGLSIQGDAISQMIEDVTMEAYATYQIKKYGGLKKKTKNKYSAVDPEIEQQFELVFKSITDVVATGAKSLGYSTNQIQNVFDNFRVKTEKISFKGLSAEKKIEALNSYFSNIFDDLTGAMIPWLEKFQKAGEGAGETISRIVTQIEIFKYGVESLGYALDSFTPEKMVEISEHMLSFFGDTTDFAQHITRFIDRFATDEKKFSIATDNLRDSLGSVFFHIKDSRDDYWNYMESLDASTESGRETIAKLLKMTDVADNYYSMLEAREEEVRSEISDVSAALKVLYGDDKKTTQQNALFKIQASLFTRNFEGVGALASEAAKISKSDYASALDYERQRAITINTLDKLNNMMGDELSESEKQLEHLNSLAESADKQVNELKDINAGIRLLNLGLNLYGDGTTTSNNLSPYHSPVLEIPTFANGGFHEGGLRIVGENGPELEYTSPSIISNQNQISEIFDISGLVAEVKQLRQELKISQFQIAKNTQKTSKKIEQWDFDGLPEERAV